MEGVAKKKKRIEEEVKDSYSKKRQPLLQVKREQAEDCEFDMEGIFETPRTLSLRREKGTKAN